MNDATPTAISAEFLAAIIEHVGHPIFVKDRNFRFVLVNQAMCELSGYRREEMIGKTDHDFFPKAEADFFREKDLELFTTGRQITIDQEPITDAAGQVHILATTKVPRRNEQGELTHLVGIIHDITELKRAEEALREAKDELEHRVAERGAELAAAQQQLVRQERLSTLGHLAGGLAHQLRNPLGAIQNATALVRKGPLTTTQRTALDIIEEEVQRADLTITDLLDYARIRPPEPREVRLDQVVEQALDAARVPESVVVKVDAASEIEAEIDPLQVQTALSNLIRNAVEAMPHGGPLHVRLLRAGDKVQIVLTDTGPGVDRSVVSRLFAPLVTTKPGGSGLGLSTARNLIENHRGTIRYTDGPDGGAEFTIELPAKADLVPS